MLCKLHFKFKVNYINIKVNFTTNWISHLNNLNKQDILSFNCVKGEFFFGIPKLVLPIKIVEK